MTVDSFLTTIFPWRGLRAANDKIRAKINQLQNAEDDAPLDYMKGYDALALNDIEKFYSNTLEIKGTIEGKLQAFLFSVAIGVTILTSSLAFLYGNVFPKFALALKVAVLVLIAVAVLFMLLGGLFAAMTIGKQILIYTHTPSDMSESEESQKRTIAVSTELNSLTNILRQNFMHVSLHCIINAICVVFLFFVLIGGLAFGQRQSASEQSVDVRVYPLASDISNLSTRVDRYLVAQGNQNRSFSSEISTVEQKVEKMTNSLAQVEAELGKVTNSLRQLDERISAVQAVGKQNP